HRHRRPRDRHTNGAPGSVSFTGLDRADGRIRRRRAAAVAAALFLAAAACGRGDAASGAADAVPDSFIVSLETSRGEIRAMFHRDWAPRGVDRVHELVALGFYDGARVYRVNEQYAQFGYSGRPALDSTWMPRRLPDEPVRASNVEGTITLARAGPESRNFVLFINLVDNAFLDTWAGDGVAGFPPVGRVISGLDVARSLNAEYG